MFSFASFPRVKKRKAISKGNGRATKIRKLVGSNPFRMTKIYKAIQPKQSLIKLKYTEYLDISGTSTAAPIQIGYQNSIFAPKVGGGGHQPLGRDQIADLYKRYQIMGMKYKVTLKNEKAESLVFNVHNFHDSLVALSDTEQMSEIGNHKNAVLGDATTGNSIKSLQGYVDLVRLSGQPRFAYMGNYRYQADVGGSPPEAMGIVFTYQTMETPGSSTVLFKAFVEITYYIRFLERKIQHSKS